MKHELTVSVDEMTKKTMDYISEEICESLNDSLGAINKLVSELFGKLEELGQTSKSISEAQSKIIENQSRNTQLLEEITKKLNYLSLPFYKRIGKKNRSNKTAPDTNKEME